MKIACAVGGLLGMIGAWLINRWLGKPEWDDWKWDFEYEGRMGR